MLHFEFLFVYGMRKSSHLTLVHVDFPLSLIILFAKKLFFLPISYLSTFAENKFAIIYESASEL